MSRVFTGPCSSDQEQQNNEPSTTFRTTSSIVVTVLFAFWLLIQASCKFAASLLVLEHRHSAAPNSMLDAVAAVLLLGDTYMRRGEEHILTDTLLPAGLQIPGVNSFVRTPVDIVCNLSSKG